MPPSQQGSLCQLAKRSYCYPANTRLLLLLLLPLLVTHFPCPL